MSFVVRVSGPEFLSEETRKAFARVEESIRQFSAHSRETIAIVRNPFTIRQDHFAFLWSRGIGVAALLPYGGRIRGGRRGDWVMEEPQENSISEINFLNPYVSLKEARSQFQQLVAGIRKQPAAVAVETSQASAPAELTRSRASHNGSGDSATADNETSSSVNGGLPIDEELQRLKAVALFTLPVQELNTEESIGDKSFIAMTLEYATSRTMFHLPNVLRITDQQGIVFSTKEIESIADALERNALQSAGPESIAGLERGSAMRHRRAESVSARRFHWWWLPVFLIPAIVLYFILRPSSGSVQEPVERPTSSTPVHRTSQIVIEVPSEVQLFVSPTVYNTRSELDRALAHREGQWLLAPGTEVTVAMDSVALARGVYGYFKVGDTWRKGKLLQTFRAQDTIKIDNFLPPLQEAGR